MYARLSIFDDLDLSLEEQFLEWSSTEGLRLSRALPGYRGLLTLVDRESRRLVGLGLYDSEEHVRQADQIIERELPASLPEDVRQSLPTRTFVGVFEVIERDGV